MEERRNTYNDQFKANDIAYKLICKVDNSTDRDENLAILTSLNNKKVQLKAVATYLQANFKEVYPKSVEQINLKKQNLNKTDLRNQILDFVIFSLAHHCMKCDADYLPYVQADSAEGDTKCFVCKLPAHKDCYKPDEVKLHLVFLCQICLQAQKFKAELEKKEEPEKEEEVAEQDDDSESDSDSDSDDSTWSKKQKKIRKRKEKPGVPKKKEEICPLLIDGKCPHGISGKNCEYTHKNTCHKYCSFGTRDMDRRGCRFGEDCRYLHPTLCQNSVVMRKCFNKSCTHAHLRHTTKEIKENVDSYKGSYSQGAKAEPPRGNYIQGAKPENSRYENRQYNNSYQSQKPKTRQYERNKPYNPNYRPAPRRVEAQSNDQEHFLCQMVEKMKEQLFPFFQQEMRRQLQHQTYQTTESQESYPSMPDAMDPTWNPSQGRW